MLLEKLEILHNNLYNVYNLLNHYSIWLDVILL